LLNKNGATKSPELDEDVRCEALLNNLAKQQRQIEDSSPPPVKKQRFLGVNKNNEVIVVDDQSSPVSSPQKRLASPPVHNHVKFYCLPETVDVIFSQISAPADGHIVVGTDQPSKAAATAQQSLQPCSKPAAVVDEVICIDDDDDDDVDLLLVTDPPKVASAASGPSVSDTKLSANAVKPQESLSSVKRLPTSVSGSGDSAATECVDIDGSATDSEQFPSSSGDQVPDSTGHVLTPPTAVSRPQQQVEEDSTSQCSSPSERKVMRLERLLEVGFCIISGVFLVIN